MIHNLETSYYSSLTDREFQHFLISNNIVEITMKEEGRLYLLWLDRELDSEFLIKFLEFIRDKKN